MEFQKLFKFIISEFLDPSKQWTDKSIDTDITSVLKDLRYPFLGDLGKTVLSAPGAERSWEKVVAMLNWLVELCRVRRKLPGPSH